MCSTSGLTGTTMWYVKRGPYIEKWLVRIFWLRNTTPYNRILVRLCSPLANMDRLLTLSLIKTLSDASSADGFLKTWRQKKKLLETRNFSFCHHVFNSVQLLYFHLKGVTHLFRVCFQSCLLQSYCMWERVNQCFFFVLWAKIVKCLDNVYERMFLMLCAFH